MKPEMETTINVQSNNQMSSKKNPKVTDKIF